MNANSRQEKEAATGGESVCAHKKTALRKRGTASWWKGRNRGPGWGKETRWGKSPNGECPKKSNGRKKGGLLFSG